MRVLTSQARPSADAAAPSDSSVRDLAVRVAAHGIAQATQAEFPSLRQRVGPVNGPPLAPAFIRHMDDQTVVALAAIYSALSEGRESFGHSAPQSSNGKQAAKTPTGDPDLHDWGIVAAPRFLGRTTMATALPKFLVEGAWGVSPHTIPYFSLHSVAGAVSQALHIQGPNFGAGGGPDGEMEALMAAIAMLHGHQLPGVLAVMTGWEPELIPSPAGAVVTLSTCRAVALALMPISGERPGLRVSIRLPAQEPMRMQRPEARKPCRLQSLAALLSDPNFAAVHWPLAGGGILAWQRAGTEGSPE